MTGSRYYAVASGKMKGPAIFTTWKKCKSVTSGVSGAKYKKFDNLADAEAYISEFRGNPKSKPKETPKKAIKELKKIEVYREIFKLHNGSVGENIVETHLKMLRRYYIKEYKVDIDGYTYRFDFAVLSGDKLVGFIEFDGKQHYEAVAKFGGAEGLRKTQYRDSKKNDYCKSKGLILLRIKYCDGHKTKALIIETFKNLKLIPKPENKTTKPSPKFIPLKKKTFKKNWKNQ